MTDHETTIARRRLLAACALLPLGAQADERFWSLLREGGCVVLMRHAQTVAGVGDPPGFRLGDCRTQRNLSDEGREQARRVGEAFRHQVWPAINSFFRNNSGEAQTREVLKAVPSVRSPENWMLVTHQVNISALTGEFPAMGELFVTRPTGGDRLSVMARLVV